MAGCENVNGMLHLADPAPEMIPSPVPALPKTNQRRPQSKAYPVQNPMKCLKYSVKSAGLHPAARHLLRIGFDMAQYTPVNAVYDIIAPEPPVESGPDAMIIPGSTFKECSVARQSRSRRHLHIFTVRALLGAPLVLWVLLRSR